MIVTIGNTKGGVGKTTIAVQVALVRRLAGRDVLLVDADRQGSAQAAAMLRAEAGRMPALSCVQLADGRILRAQLAALASKHDDTIIDAGGRDNEALRVALGRSDLLVVPVQPRAVDVWALGDIASLIGQAQEARADDGRPPAWCMDQLVGAGKPVGIGRGRPFLTPEPSLAVQAEPGSPPPHPAAAAQGHELARLRGRFAPARQPDRVVYR
jgi:cellulose biosynthesis protein BcsQ